MAPWSLRALQDQAWQSQACERARPGKPGLPAVLPRRQTQMTFLDTFLSFFDNFVKMPKETRVKSPIFGDFVIKSVKNVIKWEVPQLFGPDRLKIEENAENL